MRMTKYEFQVKTKHPNACCTVGGKPRFQIWDMLLSFGGNKLGQGNTEKEAWKDALKKENA